MSKRRRNKGRKRFPKRYCTIDYHECVKINKFGEGIVFINKKETRVPYLLLGEKARLIIFFEDKDHIDAKAIDIINPSKERKLGLDHWKLTLGSYQIAHMTDEAQDEFKQHIINSLFRKNIDLVKNIIVGARTNYRNKVVLTDGGFMPPGKKRKHSFIPQNYDLMELDFDKYSKFDKKKLIVRRLDEEIIGTPGEVVSTTDTMLGMKFNVSLDSFYQINKEMAEIAYTHIKEEISKDDVVLDLFAGAFIIGILISDNAKKVYSVEMNESTFNDGMKNLQSNNIGNLIPVNDDVNLWLEKMNFTPNTIVIDPARSGLNEKSMKIINDSGVNKIIYLSCNPFTQRTDISFLTKYKITKIQPFDFFPQTYHIENLIVLELK